MKARAAGALFGIDQEVVTLRGLLRQLRVLLWKPRRDLTPGQIQTHRLVCAGCSCLARDRSAAPLRATSSKSQPPHLVLDSHYSYYNQNLSFDHLLSGVIRH
jgi:hypothetical protein